MAIFIPASLTGQHSKELIKSFFSVPAIASYATLVFILFLTFNPYYLAQQELGKWRYDGVKTMTPQLASYFSADKHSIFYNFYPEFMAAATDRLPMKHEHLLFAGFFISLLLIASVVSFIAIKRRALLNVSWPPIFLVSLTTFLFITTFSLQFNIIDYSFWKNIYDFFSGAGGIRVVTRIWLVSYLFLFLAVAILASYVYEKTKSRAVKIILIAIGLLACVEQINLQPAYFNKLQQQQLQLKMDKIIGEAVGRGQADAFYLRWISEDEPFYRYQLMAMWSGLNLGIPTVNGYSGKRPIGYQNISVVMTDDHLVSWLDYKRPEALKNILVVEAEVKEGQLLLFQEYNLITPR